MGKPKKERSVSVRGGVFDSVVSKLRVAVREAGGSDRNFRALDYDEEEAQECISKIGRMVARLPVAKIPPAVEEYFVPVADAKVPAKHRETLAKYRRLAAEHDVPGTASVCFRVKAGFTLKEFRKYNHVLEPYYCSSLVETSYEVLAEIATTDCLVFWVPRLALGSKNKTAGQQKKLLSGIRKRLGLPAYHLSCFGQVGLLVGLILAHYKETGVRIPRHKECARTDSVDKEARKKHQGKYIHLNEFAPYEKAGLTCFNNDPHDVDDRLGVFALGIEAL